jgi:hypothetical protein
MNELRTLKYVIFGTITTDTSLIAVFPKLVVFSGIFLEFMWN